MLFLKLALGSIPATLVEVLTDIDSSDVLMVSGRQLLVVIEHVGSICNPDGLVGPSMQRVYPVLNRVILRLVHIVQTVVLNQKDKTIAQWETGTLEGTGVSKAAFELPEISFIFKY